MATESETLLPAGRQTLGLIVSIAVCFAAAGLGSLVTDPRIPNWYAQLAKPEWTPPGWLFGPVWSLLYLCMAVAAWLVWRQGGFAAAKVPLALFGVQLLLNGLWSPLFFGLKQPGLAAIDIVLLWAAILVTIVAFWRHSALASVLLAPYLAWVTFAVLLNWKIWQMNPQEHSNPSCNTAPRPTRFGYTPYPHDNRHEFIGPCPRTGRVCHIERCYCGGSFVAKPGELRPEVAGVPAICARYTSPSRSICSRTSSK